MATEFFTNFIKEFQTTDYHEKVLKSSLNNAKRIIFDMDDIRLFKKELATSIITNPLNTVPYIEEEISELAKNNLFFGTKGSFGEYSVTPRSINCNCLGKMICIEGIITSCSLVRPKVSKSIHFNEIKNLFLEKDYRDSTMITKLPVTNFTYPTKDIDGNYLTTEFGLSNYFDHQTVTIQETPETAPPGQLPRSIEVILSNDLVDTVKPGDRTRIYGIYKSLNFSNTVFPSKFKTVLIANNTEKIKEELNYEFNEKDIEDFVKISEQQNLLNLISNTVAPSICGFEEIKIALALMLVGGNEVVLKNGGRVRGDINMLLVGDPSTAKSQLLRYAINVSPLSVATTGKGSSGVGLTAAVVLDKETGDKRLEAGAMVLADRGIVCIDEFDKMNDGDRVAIHEVMEQQTVTIAKAGIHTTLNARCSVLAAANPIFGQYKDSLSPQENVKLQESLLTRFDLIFIVLDTYSISRDKKIADHVLEMHSKIYERTEFEEEGIFEEDSTKRIKQSKFRKYIQYCKKLRPALTKEAANLISKAYVYFRQKKDKNNEIAVSVTPRMLETMIRLATAHAKLRLGEIVGADDAKHVILLLRNSLFRKVGENKKKSKTVTLEELLEEMGEKETPESTQERLDERLPHLSVKILQVLGDFRDENPSKNSINVFDLLELLEDSKAEDEKIEESDVRGILDILAGDDHIIIKGDIIFFIMD